jgi:hypothetical protein
MMLSTRALRWRACTATVLFAARADAASIATLAAAQGEVKLTPPGQWEAAGTVGQAIEAGTRIRTGANGTATVRFADDSTLDVSAGSQVQLSGNKRAVAKTSIVLFFGKIWSRVTHAANDKPHYEIAMANAVAGVRGTEFGAAVADDGSVRVNVHQGEVAVDGDQGHAKVGPKQQVDADDAGVAKAQAQGKPADDAAWSAAKSQRFAGSASQLVAGVKSKIMVRKDRLAALRAKQDDVKSKLEAAKKSGDAEQVRALVKEMQNLADAIADLGDETESQFGLADRFADLAKDKRFGNINRATLEAEAASLRMVKADLDRQVREGTDISIEAMDKMLKEMHNGKPTIKDKSGSAKELFDGDDMMK